MATVVLLVQQIITMFILAGIGYILFRTGKITMEGSKVIGNILIYLVLPAVIIKGFMLERTPDTMRGLLVSAGLAAAALAICILLSRLVFKKDAIATFSSSFSNPGFFAVPLIIASMGSQAVFYAAAYIGFLNLLQFTYGTSLITDGEHGMNPKAILKAPFLTAIIVGLLIFLIQPPMPVIVTKCFDYITAINTPLAMFTVGVYLSQVNIADMFKNRVLYLVSLMRLVVIPLVVLVLMIFVPSAFADAKMVILLAAAAPVGSNVAVYAQLYDKDYGYAVGTVIISTLFSVITIPLIVSLAGMLWH